MSKIPLDELFGGNKQKPAVTGHSVYSTETGDLRKQKAQSAEAVHDGKTIRIHRSSGGRGGKVVSAIKGLPLGAEALANLCSDLKKRCGTGGSVVNSDIEIQGDQRALLVKLLLEQGFAAKLAGG